MTDLWLGPRDVAQQSGVSTDTLRHYERLGLLAAPVRTRAGYRRYHPSTVARVRLIQRALAVGFSLRDLASVLQRRDTGEPPCRRVRALVGDRLTALDRQLADLTALRDDMNALLREWDARLAQTPSGQRARLLDMLMGRAAFHLPIERSSFRSKRAARPTP
jgi:DNA-binding transcriptional MerR regulator